MALTVEAAVICHPRRRNYAAESLNLQVERIRTFSEIWVDKTVPIAKYIVEDYKYAVEHANSDYIILSVGDYEFTENFVEKGVASNADVYGCCFYDQRDGKMYSGLPRTGNVLRYQSSDADNNLIYPDMGVLIKTPLARQFKWTYLCSFGTPDHLYPFMEYADKQKAKIFTDRAIMGIHHYGT